MGRKFKIIFVVFLIFCFLNSNLFAQSESLKKVEVLILKGAYVTAARECEKILVHHHQSKIRAKAHYLLGICLLKQTEYEKARNNFATILRRYPRSKMRDEATLAIADSYLLAGDFKLAARQYEKFLEDFPHSELINIAGMHLKQSKQGRYLSNSYFSVQVGCFTNRQNAQKLRDELIDAGHQAYILQLPGDGLYRVRVGKLNNRLQAEFLEQKIKTQGYPTKVCP